MDKSKRAMGIAMAIAAAGMLTTTAPVFAAEGARTRIFTAEGAADRTSRTLNQNLKTLTAGEKAVEAWPFR